MATLDHRRGSDQDLMGVHGDVLFADPLGVRTPQAADKQPGRPGGYNDRMPSARDGRQHAADQRYLQAKAEEEDQGLLQTWFGFLFAPGSNCCSMRSKDEEAARLAGTSGRPPQQKFPSPRPDQRGVRETGREAAAAPQTMGSSRQAFASSRQSPRLDHSQAPASKPDSKLDETGALESSRQRSPSPPGDRTLWSSQPIRTNVPPLLFEDTGDLPGRDLNPKETKEDASAATPMFGEEREKERLPGVESSAPASAEAARLPPGHYLPQAPEKWTWPPWSLNSKEPCIEVYVQDDDDGAEPRWCLAEPQFRVVNKDGNDAYLCAEYEWDDEFYVQDFGPQHVRKRGQTQTVADLFSSKRATSENDLLKDTRKVDRGPDRGNGMAGFLEDSR